MTSGTLMFLGLVFAAVFLLAQAIVVPKFGDDAKARKLLRKRLAKINSSDEHEFTSLLRAKYLRELSPFAQFLESLPGMERLAQVIEQSGHGYPGYRLLIGAAVLAVAGAFIGWLPTRDPLMSLVAAVVLGALPFVKVMMDRKKRFDLIEEKLPDAIDIVKRALRAGHPFGAALRLVSEDMEQPIAKEFSQTFSDINYGNDLRRAMLGLLSRVPSVTVMSFVTAVLVQKETGGNLAEILEQIAKVVRARFRFYRRVRTLSAEGRVSAWILVLIPFLLFGVMWVTSPGYLPVLLEHETGHKLLMVSGALTIIGILWVRRIIRVES
jgi:tight adherence protein B